jgi:hypothetical protein
MPIAFPIAGLVNGQEYTSPDIPGVKYTYNAAKQVWVGATAGSGSGSSYTLPIASTTVLGGVKVGTGLTAGVDGTLAVSGGTTSITANGYTYAGGVLIQWGYVVAVPIDKHTAVTFPIAFPSSVFSVVASLVNTLAPADYWSINNIIQVGAVTRTGFHVINNKAYNNDIDLPAYWLALGN